MVCLLLGNKSSWKSICVAGGEDITLWSCEYKQNLFDVNDSGKLASEMGLDGPKRPTQMSSYVTNILQQHAEYQTTNAV